MQTPSDNSVFVAVPSYNHAPFVEECLTSIFRQTLPPAKLLVIDDGSRDGSAEVIEKVLADAPFAAEFIARENRGLAATLNEAIMTVTGRPFQGAGRLPLRRMSSLRENTRSRAASPSRRK